MKDKTIITYRDLDFEVTYQVYGKYYPATWDDPPEYPELEVLSIDYCFEYDELSYDEKLLVDDSELDDYLYEIVYTQVFGNEPWFKV